MKTNPEFERFTGFMDKLAKVPHSELKAKLDAEKRKKPAREMSLKEAARRIGQETVDGLNSHDHEAQAEKAAARLAKRMGPVHMTGGDKPSPVVEAFNQAFKGSRRRRVN